MTNRVAGKIKLQSVDQLLGVPEISGTQEIEIVRIHAFPNHPFKVLDDERMDMLVDSIRENGILNPVIVSVFGLLPTGFMPFVIPIPSYILQASLNSCTQK